MVADQPSNFLPPPFRGNIFDMMNPLRLFLVPFLLVSSFFAADAQPSRSGSPTRGDLMVANYFRDQVAIQSERCLADIHTLQDWTSRRAEYRRQLQEMLGLWPMPKRTDLKPVITGKLERDDLTVEKLYFQASPGLYVTADLYLPKPLNKPAPTILFECGHLRMMTNGISIGNKTAYQQHGEWYARNGYVCLVVDSLLMGEIQGVHAGTRDLGMWWWNSRGYTPEGVEVWFGIRALDYLCTRPEVDTNRFGITGHSGGGAYSWMIAALDDRIKVAAPLAGMTDIQNHIVDGVMDHHCDCNFFVNIYRWDYPQVAALLAPRPLLMGGSDKDRLFWINALMRIHKKVQHIYQLYGAADKLGLLIVDGPHADLQEFHVPVFRWFNHYLKGEDPLIEMAAKPLFNPMQLKVFDTLPTDAINSNIQAVFVPPAKPFAPGEAKREEASLIAKLKAKTFSGWPSDNEPLDPKLTILANRNDVRLRAWDFTSQQDVHLRLYLLENAATRTGPVQLVVLDNAGWTPWLAAMRAGFESDLSEELTNSVGQPPAPDAATFTKWKQQMDSAKTALAFFAPRGVGLTAFSPGRKNLTHIRRRFMLLGQTLDSMRVWDIRRAVQLLHSERNAETDQIGLQAKGQMGVNALYCALFEPNVRRLDLEALPKSQAEGPDYLNVLRILDLPQVLEMVGNRVHLH